MERKIIEVPLGYPTSTIFLDESRARASGGRFFAIAAVKVRRPGKMARALRHIRDEGSGFNGEFKFKNVTDGTLPRYYAAADLLESPDVQVHACVVDTVQFDPFAKRDFWRVHSDITTQLLVASINKRELVTALIDEISTPKEVAYADSVRDRVNKRLGASAVISAVCLDSKSNDMLQVADLVAGAIAYDRGLRASTYRSRTDEKQRLTRRVKAALGCTDFADGRTSSTNIATFRAPPPRIHKARSLTVVRHPKAG